MGRTPKKSLKGSAKKALGTAKKAWGTKQVLASPFSAALPKPVPGALEGVLKALESVFPTPPLRREPRPSKKTLDSQEKPLRTNTGVKRKPLGFVLGLNEVTKKLERNELALVVTVRDVLPVLISHVPVQCFLKGTALVFVPSTGVELAVILGSRTAMAFGLTRAEVERKDENDGSPSIARRVHDDIARFAVKLRYPWLSAARGDGPVPPLPEPEMKEHESIRKEEEALIANRMNVG